jgi:hypothetical protein
MQKKFDDIFVSLDQIGIIVPYEECDEMTENMKEVFNLSDEQISGGVTMQHENTVYRGQLQTVNPEVHMKFFDKFPVEIEYLSPVSGNSAWMEYEKKYRKGIHHIRFNVNSHQDAVDYLAEKGIPLYHVADSPRGKGMKFAYFDSLEKLGFYIETINFAEFQEEK